MDLNGSIWTKENIEFVEKAIEVKNKGYYLDGTQLTQKYNEILGKRLNPTNCGSCIRGRIQELENALNHYKEQLRKAQEASKQPEPTVDTPEENKEPTVKKAGRPKKN